MNNLLAYYPRFVSACALLTLFALTAEYVGAQVPDYRGKVVIIVDNTVAAALIPNLDRLVVDLTGDGWRVLRHDVDPGPSVYDSNFAAANAPRVREVRSLIRADYLAAPTEVKAVFLIGHVPVPYSGTVGITTHYAGAAPADVFYGDMTSPYSVGGWTDTQSSQAAPNVPQFNNAPTDGKFDQNAPPAILKLGVGRVDLYNLPTFGDPPSILISGYLEKDHNFRKGILAPTRQALIAAWDSGFGIDATGLNAVFGSSNVQRPLGERTIKWFPNVQNQDFLVGYGGGNGTITSAHGIGTTGPNPLGPNLAAEGYVSMDDTSCCDPVTGYCGCTDSVHNNFVQFSSRVVFV